MNTNAIIVPPRMITLVLLAALSTLSLNLFLPSLTNIALDLQADYALVSLSIAGYLAVTAMLQLQKFSQTGKPACSLVVLRPQSCRTVLQDLT